MILKLILRLKKKLNYHILKLSLIKITRTFQIKKIEATKINCQPKLKPI